MNSAVRLIFNESFAEKKMFVGSINNARDTLEKQKNHKNALLKKKKKKKKNTADLFISIQTGYQGIELYFLKIELYNVLNFFFKF